MGRALRKKDIKPAALAPVVDAQVLRILNQTLSDQQLRDLIDCLKNDLAQRVERLGDAAATGDADTLQRESHSVKSASGNFGLMLLSSLSGQAENLCRNGHSSEAAKLAPHIRDAFQRAVDSLSRDFGYS